jgi:hypothetical protein
MPQVALVKDRELFHLLCVVMNYNYRPYCTEFNLQYKHSHTHATDLSYTTKWGGSRQTENTLIPISILIDAN